MGLPININDLINGQTVEWERLEFKKGWNPEEIVHTMCAFANDINNWGGGYIIIGIAESDGKPILPPVGLALESLDRIQGEVLSLSYQLLPNYFPLVQPYVLQGKHILVLWCSAGDHRPYIAPITQVKAAQRFPYIRFGSRTIIAKEANLRKLQELTARIPFDDRINGKATIDDLDLGLIQAFLHEVKSDLYEESKQLPFTDVCLNMKIVSGPREALRPLNIGILFFSKNPEKFINRAWIELVIHKDNVGDNFTEKYFKGPIHHQLREVLGYFKTYVIEEKVSKVPYKAEANRYFNFPYLALEEALSNAVYHKDYHMEIPIEIQLWPNKIEILSFPGPVPPVDEQILKKKERIIARGYRNRRIGDFLKELDLTEGRGSGLPSIKKAMKNNGSPEAIFETNEQSVYFLTVLPIREDVEEVLKKEVLFTSLEELIHFLKSLSDLANDQVEASNNEEYEVIKGVLSRLNDQASDQAVQIIEKHLNVKVLDILNILEKPKKRVEILEYIGLRNHSNSREKYLDPLVKMGWIEMTIPETPTHQNQKYRLTREGELLYKIVFPKKSQ